MDLHVKQVDVKKHFCDVTWITIFGFLELEVTIFGWGKELGRSEGFDRVFSLDCVSSSAASILKLFPTWVSQCYRSALLKRKDRCHELQKSNRWLSIGHMLDHSPKLQCFVDLSSHPNLHPLQTLWFFNRVMTFLCSRWTRFIIPTAARGLCHVYVNKCCFWGICWIDLWCCLFW